MGIIFKKPQGDSVGGGNVNISRGQFLATENQTSFVIQNTVTENDLLMIHTNNLFLEKDINYSISEDSVSETTTITLPSLKVNDIVSWILIKVGDTPVTPEVKQAICGLFNCGELICGQGVTIKNSNKILDDIFYEKSALSEDFIKQILN